jgi:hypothetical protein
MSLAPRHDSPLSDKEKERCTMSVKKSKKPSDAIIKKNRIEYLRLQCRQNGKHEWQLTTCDMYRKCSICDKTQKKTEVNSWEDIAVDSVEKRTVDIVQVSMW